jgi:uncharacterized protein (DUF1697 family)
MDTFVALFRGVNIGGKNSLPMRELVSIFESLGASDVRTYIQSGNVVFQSARKSVSSLAKRITAEVRDRYGFEPYILVMSLAKIETAIKKNPFPEAEADPRSLHLGFLASVPKKPDVKKPEGVGRSKLAASCEKLLGVPMTDRNWNTVCRLRDMAMKKFPSN